MYEEECSHQEIDRNGVCRDCGLQTDDRAAFEEKAKGDKSSAIVAMLLDLEERYPLPELVSNFVVVHAKKSDKKCQRRRFNLKELYAYIYFGYTYHNIPFDPHELSQAIGLSKTEKAQAIKIVSGFDKSGLQFTMPVCVMHPSAYLSLCFDRLKHYHSFTESQKSRLLAYTDCLVRFDPLLLNERHGGIAAGIIRQFFIINGIDHGRMEEMFSITSSYLKTITTRVADSMSKMERVAQIQINRSDSPI